MKSPFFDRLLLRLFPRWFREEFGVELAAHLEMQRGETRYMESRLGAVRFCWDAARDAVRTSAALRLGRARERWSAFFHGGSTSERAGGGMTVDALTRDVRHAVRALARTPGYALVFILTLGLGIGANTAMFSAVNGVLLRPLPHEDGDRLVYLHLSAPGAGYDNVGFSVPELADFRAGIRSLEEVAEFSALDFTMLGADMPRRVRAGVVSGNYFGVLGLSPGMGRTIGPEDDGPTAPAVMILSDGFWRTAFGGDPGVVGGTVEINGRRTTIVGVAAPAPSYPEQTDVFVNVSASPHHLDAAMNHDRRHRMTDVFARLAPEGTIESAQAEASAVLARLGAEYPEAYDVTGGYEVGVTPLKAQLTTRARPMLLLLLGTAFLVLVIACANLANLTLTRVLGRDHELAIRVSLGASRATLRRELLAESFVLSLAGAALGLLLAFLSLDLIVAFASRFTERASEISFDAAVFGFAFVAAVAASLFFTVVPTLPDGESVGGALTRSGTRSTVGSRSRRTQRVLVVAQIATSFMLLVGAGLLLRTMMQLGRVDPGYDTEQILSMDLPADAVMPTDTETRNRYLAFLEAVRAVPGVQGAALSGDVPLSGSSAVSFPIDVDLHEPRPGAPAPQAELWTVSPGYFALMDIALLRGREFVTTDLEDAQKVVIINESMARTYFGDRDPIGRRIAWKHELLNRYGGVGPDWRTVVGLVADTRYNGLDADVVHTMYNPYPQVRLRTGSLMVRVSRDAATIAPAIRQAILSINPQQPIENVATLDDLSSRSIAERRLSAVLLGAFASLAMAIAAVGIGGVLAFSVGRRTREFGIRCALGALRRQIWFRVLTEGAVLALAGIALGTVGALAVTRVLAGLLYGVPPLDPVTFVAVGLILAAVTIVAAWMPAWRAAHVSPTDALAAD